MTGKGAFMFLGGPLTMRSLCASRGDIYFKIDVTLEGDSLRMRHLPHPQG
jgi:hypothetical protein